MERRTVIKGLAGTLPALWLSRALGAGLVETLQPGEPVAKGPFKPSWDSLKQYAVPDWYKRAKFGIWAHWGAQCQPEHGDWYAREMYQEGSRDYKSHIAEYGHPSKSGFKDIIPKWKAEKWDPDHLLELYKKAGARYFVAMANHHDNFDNYDSKYQPWNSTKLGPEKDIIGGWAKAARKQGMHFGVSVHAAHAWTWYEVAQRADKTGPMAGIPYDGKLTKADGKGTWWDGMDPQALYAQDHALSKNSEDNGTIHKIWGWDAAQGASIPDKEYCEKFYNRTADLINKYSPDLIYFDDTVLPLYPISDAGLRIAAHLYNSSIKKHGKLEAVLNGKILDEEQRKCMVWDIERGQSNRIEPFVWQTDTCIGSWHYDRSIYDNHYYKSAKTVIHTLADVVSKNGNLLLSVPVRADGTIDSDEQAVVAGITAWMSQYSEAIYDTTPWKIFGEGPAMEEAAPLSAQGFNEGKGKPFGAEDIRFTLKGDVLYCIVLGSPANGQVVVKSLAAGSKHYPGEIAGVELLGQRLTVERNSNGLVVKLPEGKQDDIALVLKVLPA
ncbi:alpha-L-fucosidase [Chitinophaga oryziterrae]|uniref:alpha-L-fucosidase n=1 Tax=Chitinophaga oryziterrae TaxID=1031224 RepID=A0A6N8J2M2_9BACT|nr:alpha-L-fucosidase [Chitinophaga oryziterrae]MVT39475.1 alpha-L-fucosidase [Chitinophaga oryziterrae]